MKTYIKILIAVVIAACAASAVYYVKTGSKAYSIGDRGPAGGWIFYVKDDFSDGWRYLEAAPEDLCASSRWNNGKDVETGANGTALGTGKSNTEKIIKVQGRGRYAAKICSDYTGGWKNDWYLPSIDELNMIYQNLHKKHIGGFTDFSYKSSTEINIKQVRSQYFKDGSNSGYGDKSFGPGAVRPVRAF